MKKTLLAFAVYMMILGVSTPANAALTTLQVASCQPVVYDMTNGTYWYPLMTNMTGMTKAQQQCYINQLNCQGYGGISDWNFATMQQVIDMAFSVAEGAPPAGMGPPGAESFLGVNPTVYFEPTGYIPDFVAAPVVITGRTIDEWTANELPDGSVVNWYGEGEYHIPVMIGDPLDPTDDVMIFDYDVNWVADNTPWAPLPLGYPIFGPPGYTYENVLFECSAWVVSETRPIPAPGALLLGSMGVGLVSWLRRRKTL